MTAPSAPRDPNAHEPDGCAVQHGTRGESLQQVLDEAKRRFVPNEQAEKRLQKAAAALLERGEQVSRDQAEKGRSPFEPMLVGSAAKHTWIPGHVDLDLFLLYPPTLTREELETQGLEAGQEILPESKQRYAEHPYVVGPFLGFQADVVPAYKVTDGKKIQSSVDRTPFHNEWVKKKIAAHPELTTEIRLVKSWLRGIEVYGADTARRGISGYLAEVLTIHHGGFLPTLEQAQGFAPGTRIDPTGVGTGGSPPEPLVVIDPVDPTRNAAAAVREDRLARFAQAAKEFLQAPSHRFFDPAPLVPPRLEAARRLLGEGGLVVLTFPEPEMREDAVDPHLERAAATLGRRLEALGFDVTRTWGGRTPDARSALALVTSNRTLARTRLHVGPPLGIGARSAEFRSKYEDHPDTVEGPFEMEWKGKRRLAVRLKERNRDLMPRVQECLDSASLGKHADRAIAKGPLGVYALEESLAEPALAQIVASLLSPLDPWQRQGHPTLDYPAGPADGRSGLQDEA